MPASARGVHNPWTANDRHRPRRRSRGYYARAWSLVVIAGLVLACLKITAPFVASTLWAIILAVSVWPLFAAMTRMLGGRRGLAAFAVSFAFMAVFLLPMVAAVMSAADHASSVLHWIGTVEAHGLPGPPPDVAGWPLVGPHLHDAWARLSTEGGEAFARNQAEIRTAVEWLLTQGGSLGLGLLEFALAIVITGLFLSNASPAVRLARSFAEKVGGAEALQLLPLAARTIRAVSFGIVGTALVEAVLATIGYARGRRTDGRACSAS